MVIFTDDQKQKIECLRRKNFNPEDFFKSDVAEKECIVNFPKDNEEEIINNLMIVADKIQEVRDLLNHPIIINSAYRSPEVNKLVGSKDVSQHIKGQAVDFICPDFGNPASIFLTLQQNKVTVDQCLMEGTWIHVSIKKTGNRNQFAKLINGTFTPVNTKV